jgi:hypothetical protein
MQGQRIHEVFPARAALPDYGAGHLVDLVLGNGPHVQTLRRLGLRDAMARGLSARLSQHSGGDWRSGYNPDEPRDWHGRWTSSGASGQGRWTGAYGLHGGRLIRIEDIEDDEPESRLPGEDDEFGEDKELREDLERELLEGKPWPAVTHDLIKSVLAPQGRVMPTLQIYVPRDGNGPLLAGSDGKEDFEGPPEGYDIVTLKGTPQYTYSRGQETNHAADSIEAAIAMAMTNRYSEIYFNRSFSTLSGGGVQSALRSDVVGVVRPEIEQMERYFPHEVLSPRQPGNYREGKMPNHPNVGKVEYTPYRARI